MQVPIELIIRSPVLCPIDIPAFTGCCTMRRRGGAVLLAAAAIALILDNSRLSSLYGALLDTPMTIRIGALNLDKPLLLWINDGLMAIFFFYVGLEIKKEVVVGALSNLRAASLPIVAAVGGMIVPAIVYSIINIMDATALRGWAIPAATDIAFAVAVVALLGPRVPPALKVFLLALAIIDDLGAIVIIALFYTANLSVLALALAAVGIAVLIALNMGGVTRMAPYALVGVFIWVCVLKSGVHATLAGVVVALAIPAAWQSGATGDAARRCATGTASMGDVSRGAAVRVCQRRRQLGRLHSGETVLGGADRHRDGTVRRKTARHLWCVAAGHSRWHREPARGRDLEAALCHRHHRRHRLHHEPVHRHARFRGSSPRR